MDLLLGVARTDAFAVAFLEWKYFLSRSQYTRAVGVGASEPVDLCATPNARWQSACCLQCDIDSYVPAIRYFDAVSGFLPDPALSGRAHCGFHLRIHTDPAESSAPCAARKPDVAPASISRLPSMAK